MQSRQCSAMGSHQAVMTEGAAQAATAINVAGLRTIPQAAMIHNGHQATLMSEQMVSLTQRPTLDGQARDACRCADGRGYMEAADRLPLQNVLQPLLECRLLLQALYVLLHISAQLPLKKDKAPVNRASSSASPPAPGTVISLLVVTTLQSHLQDMALRRGQRPQHLDIVGREVCCRDTHP